MMILFSQMQLVSWGSQLVSSSWGLSPLCGAVVWSLPLRPTAVVCSWLIVGNVFECFSLIVHAVSECLLLFTL